MPDTLRAWRYRLIAVIGIVALLGIAPWLGWHAWKESSWHQVEGRVRSASIVERRVRRSWNPTRYELEVEYDFTVDGRRFISRRWAWADEPSHTSKPAAEAQVQALAPGTSVIVYYDPDSPGDAVLARESDRGAWIALAGGAYLLLMGVVLERRRQKVGN